VRWLKKYVTHKANNNGDDGDGSTDDVFKVVVVVIFRSLQLPDA
jgi:hypothetical protein